MKKLSAHKWRLLSGSLALLISACTPNPPDVAVFENLIARVSTDPVTQHIILKPDPVCQKEIGEPECLHGVYIISKKQIFVGEKKEHWFMGKPRSQIIRESIYVPAKESYAPLAQYIINSCEKMKCNDQVDRFKVQLDELGQIGHVISGGSP